MYTPSILLRAYLVTSKATVFSVVYFRTKMVSCEVVKQEEKWEELQKFLCFLVIVFDLMIIQDCSWRVSSSHLFSLLFSQKTRKKLSVSYLCYFTNLVDANF